MRIVVRSLYRFVYVEDDGTARELTKDEIEYLETDFHGSDGARPNIKFDYWQRTPDGRLRGFLDRSKLPAPMKLQLDQSES
jgi:hypothetical protein